MCAEVHYRKFRKSLTSKTQSTFDSTMLTSSLKMYVLLVFKLLNLKNFNTGAVFSANIEAFFSAFMKLSKAGKVSNRRKAKERNKIMPNKELENQKLFYEALCF